MNALLEAAGKLAEGQGTDDAEAVLQRLVSPAYAEGSSHGFDEVALNLTTRLIQVLLQCNRHEQTPIESWPRKQLRSTLQHRENQEIRLSVNAWLLRVKGGIHLQYRRRLSSK